MKASYLYFVIILACSPTQKATQTVASLNTSDPIQDVKKAGEKHSIKQTNVTDVTDATKNIDSSKPVYPNHGIWDALLQKYVSATGNVNYKGFKKDYKRLATYLALLSKFMPTKSWSKADKLAFWINVYNAYTIKTIVDNYPVQSIKKIPKPWDNRIIRIGEKWYTLNDIEHRKLRKMGDPRIHFGINCASYSCPKLFHKAFTAKNVNKLLNELTTSFINDPIRNSITPNKIGISKIFSWFKKDFTTKQSLISYLNAYSKIKIANTAKLTYLKYNWNLNE